MNMNDVMQATGTYLSSRYSQKSANIVEKWCIDRGVPRNRAQVDRLHTTILYSQNPIADEHLEGLLVKPIDVYTGELCIWPTTWSRGEGITNALILLMDAPEVEVMHHMLVEKHGATHSFNTFIPHVTLSYNIGNASLKSFGKFPRTKLQIVSLYHEDLMV